MAIQLEEERQPGLPVVKRTALGQVFNGAIVRVQQRDRLKKNEQTGAMEPILKGNGKAKQEMVVTALTLPGTTAPVGLGEDEHMPEEGELVRVILKGKAFGDYIESKAELGRPIQVGDIIVQKTEYAQVYDANGNPVGNQLKTQDELNAVPRNRSVGVYGEVSLRAPKDGSEWITKAEEAYHKTTPRIAAEPVANGGGYDDVPPEPPYGDDEPPF